MPTHGARGGRSVQALAWVMHTPRRAAAVAIAITVAVLVVTVTVLGLATRGDGQAARPGAPAVDRSSCRAVTSGFATDFFTGPAAAGWHDRVARWVDPTLRDPVANIDPDGVPAGTVTFEDIDEQSGACDAFVTVAPGGLRVRIEASTTPAASAGADPDDDGQWYVIGWGTP